MDMDIINLDDSDISDDDGENLFADMSQANYTRLFNECQKQLTAGPKADTSKVFPEQSAESELERKRGKENKKDEVGQQNEKTEEDEVLEEPMDEIDQAFKEYDDYVVDLDRKKAEAPALAKAQALAKMKAKEEEYDRIQEINAAKRLEKKNKKKRTDIDLEIIEPDSDDEDEEIAPLPVKEFRPNIRVTYRGQMFKYSMSKKDTIFDLKNQVSGSIGVDLLPPYYIMMYVEGVELPLENHSTIEELGLSFLTVVEALKMAPSKRLDVGGEDFDDPRLMDPTLIRLRLQHGLYRKKVATIFVKRTEPLVKLPELYLEESKWIKDKTAGDLRLMFDGELLELNETPDSLGLEDEDCIDAFIN